MMQGCDTRIKMEGPYFSGVGGPIMDRLPECQKKEIPRVSCSYKAGLVHF